MKYVWVVDIDATNSYKGSVGIIEKSAGVEQKLI